LLATNVYHIKFYYVLICFLVALGSYFFCHNRRDWAWLAGGMAFTAGADYFLILHNAHLPGVAVFCFTHLCYGMRAHRFPLRRVVFVFALVGMATALCVAMDEIMALALLYASLFAISLLLHIKHRRTLHNAPLILTGLILFALCDIFVLLYNVPRYLGIMQELRRVSPLIWLFYLPAQSLLAVSAVRFERKKIHDA